MYDKNQKRDLSIITVEILIKMLKPLPQDAKILICGDDYCYIHVESDGTIVNIDNEPLDDCYDEDIDLLDDCDDD